MTEAGKPAGTSKIYTLVLVATLLVAAKAAGKGKPDPNKESLAAYLAQARQGASAAATPGSLWSPQGRFGNLPTDYKASQINDLILIRVVEETSAESNGNVKSERTFKASSGISGLLGLPGASSGLQTIFSPNSAQALDGKAQAATGSRTTASLTGYVKEVLPNGFLVIEAARELETNNQRQTLMVRGVVRPGDIATDNSVPSSSISHLEVTLKGKGVISDGTRPPNLILRAILKVVGF